MRLIDLHLNMVSVEAVVCMVNASNRSASKHGECGGCSVVNASNQSASKHGEGGGCVKTCGRVVSTCHTPPARYVQELLPK